jgi:hypothetical protein
VINSVLVMNLTFRLQNYEPTIIGSKKHINIRMGLATNQFLASPLAVTWDRLEVVMEWV